MIMKFALPLLYVIICITHSIKSDICTEEAQCSICNRYGFCESDCYIGYYGNRCTLPCSPNCLNRKCKLLKDIGIENCTDGCAPGYTDTNCKLEIPCRNTEDVCSKCPSDCDGQLCRMTNSCVKECKDSYYGAGCKSCSLNCELCDRKSGTCSQCKPNWVGPECQYPCTNCLGECDKTGCNDGCKRGYYGRVCIYQCSANCKNTSGLTMPSLIPPVCGMDGTCLHGCKDGWYGSTCGIQCGQGCNKGKCSEDGSCEEGCMFGYYGKECKLCPPNCHGGQCEQRNGLCSGCRIGFFGRLCNEICRGCIHDRCSQTTGTCIESGAISNKTFLGIGLALTTLLCVIAGLLIAHLCRKQRQKRNHRNQVDAIEALPSTLSISPYHSYSEIADSDFGNYDVGLYTEAEVGVAYKLQYLTPTPLE